MSRNLVLRLLLKKGTGFKVLRKKSHHLHCHFQEAAISTCWYLIGSDMMSFAQAHLQPVKVHSFTCNLWLVNIASDLLRCQYKCTDMSHGCFWPVISQDFFFFCAEQCFTGYKTSVDVVGSSRPGCSADFLHPLCEGVRGGCTAGERLPICSQ